MNQVEQLEYQKAQVAKVLASHGADSDYLLNAVLVAKAMSLGIENPFAWATKMFRIIEENKWEQTNTLALVKGDVFFGFILTEAGGLLCLGENNGRGGVSCVHFTRQRAERVLEMISVSGVKAMIRPTGSPGKFSISFDKNLTKN